MLLAVRTFVAVAKQIDRNKLRSVTRTWQQHAMCEECVTHVRDDEHTAVVKSLLTVTTLLQQILDCGCCAQCKWR